MSDIIKVTSKGQVTLPKEIRRKLQISKDSYIAVDIIGDYIIMKKVGLKLKELSELVQKNATKKSITKKEINDAILQSRNEVWK
jgi:AbrB family looped-hinge helix DNA binding protein